MVSVRLFDSCQNLLMSLGYARHRTLLYKYLADAIALPARLRMHTSILQLPAFSNASPAVLKTHGISLVEVFVDKWFVVDLLRDIGELYEEESLKATEYKQIPVTWEDGSVYLFIIYY